MPIPERGFGMGIRNVTGHNLVRLWQVTVDRVLLSSVFGLALFCIYGYDRGISRNFILFLS